MTEPIFTPRPDITSANPAPDGFKWVPNPAYDKAEYEEDPPGSCRFRKRTPEERGETFTATPALRWVRADGEGVYLRNDFTAPQHLKLQQAWTGSLGTVEWRDVETVEEKL